MWSFEIDTYELSLLVLGLAMMLAAWLPHLFTDRGLTLPIFYVIGGLLLFQVPGLPSPSPLVHGGIAERLTELAVIVSLMGAGLKIDRAFSLRGWATTWRLLAITMPLTIAAAAWIGWWVVGLAPAAAVLLGAVIAPTDPVLASDVQVGAPNRGGEDEVRFSLTSEAGLNDGLAFPFTYLAIAMALYGPEPGEWLAWWALVDVGYRLVMATGVGLLTGWVMAKLLFRPPAGGDPLAKSMEGSLAVASTFIAYGACEVLQCYGFLGVFVAACTLRRYEQHHEAHEALHTFTEDIERVLIALLLMLLGGASVDLLSNLTPAGAAAAMLLVVVVRPAAGYVGLLGRDEPWQERLAIAFFGIRGIGSLYYLAYAANHADFDAISEVWAIVTATILLSALLHGLTAMPTMRRLDALRRSAG